MKPSVGRIVHYVSYGTPGGEYTSECRAAIVTAVTDEPCFDQETGKPLEGVFASLAIFNPTGQFFNRTVRQDEAEKPGGTWHWPERVE